MPRTVHLTAPVNALLQGLYEQDMTVGALRHLGDHGLGTFNDLDGEMLVTDGVVYQVDAGGRARVVDDQVRTPFACVTAFGAAPPDTEEEFTAAPGRDDLLAILPLLIPSDNMLYALRVDGEFDLVHCRSVPRQENYRPLVEVTREQPEFEFTHTAGRLVGFYAPKFLASLTVPGIHLHFLDADRAHGGHVLGVRLKRCSVAVRHAPRLCLTLPMGLDFLTTDLDRDPAKDLDQAERARSDRT